jgi:hypothetical protein
LIKKNYRKARKFTVQKEFQIFWNQNMQNKHKEERKSQQSISRL